MVTSVIPPSTSLPVRGVFVCRCPGKVRIVDGAPEWPCSVRIVLPDHPTLIWPFIFACMTCRGFFPHKKDDILRLDLSSSTGWEECRKLGPALDAKCLWRLEIKDSPEIVHTIAPRNSSKRDLETLVRIACSGSLGLGSEWPEIEHMVVRFQYGDFRDPSRVIVTSDH